MNNIQCYDKDGTAVVCKRNYWEAHIIDAHPEMKGCEGHVKATIESPYQIYQDSTHPNRRILYRPFILPKPYDRQYLRVAIDYRHRRWKKPRGYVVTAFSSANIKKGDILVWSSML